MITPRIEVRAEETLLRFLAEIHGFQVETRSRYKTNAIYNSERVAGLVFLRPSPKLHWWQSSKLKIVAAKDLTTDSCFRIVTTTIHRHDFLGLVRDFEGRTRKPVAVISENNPERWQRGLMRLS